MKHQKTRDDEIIHVNQVLNSKPQLGPIPGEQVIPWAIIALSAWLVAHETFKLGWVATGLVAAWGCASWWMLTGNQGWRFLHKFFQPPRWTRGHITYTSLLSSSSPIDKPINTKGKKTRRNR